MVIVWYPPPRVFLKYSNTNPNWPVIVACFNFLRYSRKAFDGSSDWSLSCQISPVQCGWKSFERLQSETSIFKFLCCSAVEGKRLIGAQTETSAFKFLPRSVDGNYMTRFPAEWNVRFQIPLVQCGRKAFDVFLEWNLRFQIPPAQCGRKSFDAFSEWNLRFHISSS